MSLGMFLLGGQKLKDEPYDKIMADGRRQILAVLLPGDLFDLNGFMAAHMDHSIASLTSVELATLHDDFLNDVRRDHPDLEKVLWCDLHVIAATQREWIVSRRRSRLSRATVDGRRRRHRRPSTAK